MGCDFDMEDYFPPRLSFTWLAPLNLRRREVVETQYLPPFYRNCGYYPKNCPLSRLETDWAEAEATLRRQG